MKTQKTTKTTKKACLMGYRKVVIRNNKGEYALQFNTCFGIVVWGKKEDAAVLFTKDAVDVLKDLRRLGNHIVWLEQVGECPCGCHLIGK